MRKKLELNAIVVQRVIVAPGLMILRIVPDGWELPDFTPGQYAVLGLPGSAPRCELSDNEEPLTDENKMIRRAYSISSSSINKEYIEFYITLVRSGSLTPRVFNLKEGDRIYLSKKYTGMFTMNMVPANQNVALLSTGTGIAPYMSMLRTDLLTNAHRKVVVIHGARHSWDLGYRAELNTLATVCPNFHYVPAITRPQLEHTPWGGRTGYIQELWQQRVVEQAIGESVTPDNTHLFLCGNPSMIDTMIDVVGAEGYREHLRKSPGQVHLERYW